MAHALADRAQQLCDDDVPVDEAVAQLIQLSRDVRFELAAAYADAVRQHGGALGQSAALLELARYEAERPLTAAMSDPDRLPGRMLAGYIRAIAWGTHWAIFAAVLLLMATTLDDPGVRWVALGCGAFFGIRAALPWYGNRHLRELPAMPHSDDASAGEGAVPRLAREVARQTVVLAARDDEHATAQLNRHAIGHPDTPVCRRRAQYVLREAERIVAMYPLAPGIGRRARRMLKNARPSPVTSDRR